jgi:hypothetical protein
MNEVLSHCDCSSRGWEASLPKGRSYMKVLNDLLVQSFYLFNGDCSIHMWRKTKDTIMEIRTQRKNPVP